MKKSISLKSYAKINLSLDVGKPMANGMHPVDTIMQLTDLYDVVEVSCEEACADDKHSENAKGRGHICEATLGEIPSIEALCEVPRIMLSCSNPEIPNDESNLAYKAAILMIEKFGFPADAARGTIKIHIEKNIPIAAGLAGGSGNGAAVILALNSLWNLNLSLEELMKASSSLGSDVPFCLMGMAKLNESTLPRELSESPLASTCARGRGTGVDMEPLTPLDGALVIAKPNFGLSTKEVYKGFDKCEVDVHPNNDKLAAALADRSRSEVIPEMINLLELYSLEAEPRIAELKSEMMRFSGVEKVLMSGSGPTVYALFPNKEKASSAAEEFSHSHIFCTSARLL